jgi:ATP-binding cassette subfamily B protein
MIVTSFAEIISIGAILPFITVLTNPSKIYEYEIFAELISIIGINKPSELPLILTILFGIAVLFSGVMRLVLLWANTRLSFATGADLGVEIYRRTLYQPYANHCSRNSSEIIAGITLKANDVIVSIILPIINLLSSSLILVLIATTLFYINLKVSIITLFGFGLIYITIIKITKKQTLLNSHSISIDSVKVIKSLQEGLGGIRDVLLSGSQEKYCQIYKDADFRLRKAQGMNVFIAASPRYGVEALGMILLASSAYLLTKQNNDVGTALPIIATLAVGAQRLLPALQQVYGAWISITSNIITLKDVLELLNQPIKSHLMKENENPIKFEKYIKLQELEFKYEQNGPMIINRINLKISKGSRIGIIGETASGKTTLIDLVMGLLEPSSGNLVVDDLIINSSNQQAWQVNIAHVPQSIYLADSTIEENIAFDERCQISPLCCEKRIRNGYCINACST